MRKLTKKVVKEEKVMQLYINEICQPKNWYCRPGVDFNCTNYYC